MGGTLLGLLFFPTETGMSVFAFSVVHNLDQGLEMGKNQNEKNLKAKKLPPTRAATEKTAGGKR